MTIWRKYKHFIFQNTPLTGEPNSLEYWRDYLFGVILVYLIPFSILALIPSIFVTYITEHYFLMWFDILAFFTVVIMAFTTVLSMRIKKILLIFLLNALALMLMLELGSFGPGLMYLVASGVFVALLFPSKYSWFSVLIALVICIFFGIQSNYDLIADFPGEKMDFIGWLALSINVVFINGVISMVVPILFEKMQQSIAARKEMENQLLLKQDELNVLVQELEIQNANLNQLIKGVSEDMQEPLRDMISFLGQLQRKYISQLDEKANQYIDFAISGGKRMREIILALFGIAKVDKEPIILEEVSIEEVIRIVTLLQKKEILKTKAQIIHKELPVIISSKTHLIQLFNELVSNALRFRANDRPPEVEICAKEGADFWQFSIRDNGVGFDSGDGVNPFLLFHKLHPEQELDGFGIGLALVRKISENLNGSIWVESIQNQGSVFFLKIPKAA